MPGAERRCDPKRCASIAHGGGAGVAQLHLIHSYRVRKATGSPPARDAAGLPVAGLEQSRDTVLPELGLATGASNPSRRICPAWWRAGALFAHPGDYPPCSARPATADPAGDRSRRAALFPTRWQKLGAAGCEIVSLGPRILRAENALRALLGRLF